MDEPKRCPGRVALNHGVLSDRSIGKVLGVSAQAVNMARKKAERKLARAIREDPRLYDLVREVLGIPD